MTKKNWIVPELIVLVRNKPEEAVLTSCKNYGSPPAPLVYKLFACRTNARHAAR